MGCPLGSEGTPRCPLRGRAHRDFPRRVCGWGGVGGWGWPGGAGGLAVLWAARVQACTAGSGGAASLGGRVNVLGTPRVCGGGAAPAGEARGRRTTAERAASGSAWGFVSGSGGGGWRLGGTVTPCHARPCPT